MSNALSVEEFHKLIEESYKITEKIDLIESEEIAPLKTRLKKIDSIILTQLDAIEENSVKSKWGTVSRRRTYSVQTPKTQEDKQALFNWLEAKGPDVFFHYVGVNSQALNALYKETMEIAKEAGDMDFVFPGVGAPKLQESITRRVK